MACILFVEDEAQLRTLIGDTLVELGHEVQVAADAPEAVALLQQSAYDVVISDVTMPGGVSGIELAELVLANHPATRVILVSGHARMQLPPIPATVEFLPKPYRISQLLAFLPEQ
ncbi:response regulator [Pseudoxanthomonas gei]|uniref:Response regulator n=1 Tax=Pseudoxanthomonas gei TaxID=1383030 RepID=A0ABX0AAI4_9GAMM|nr:response regulator [Pseudoxanthomonas gei]NDK38554.1 response regulator [Pseudoxanthomonas gei]